MDNNDRLIGAVQRSTRRLASSGNFDMLLKDALAICVEAVGAYGGTIYLHDAASRRLSFQHVLPEEIVDKLPAKDIPDDFGTAGKAFQTRQTLTIEFEPKAESARSAFEQSTGVTLRSMIAVPLMMENEEPIGVVQLINKQQGCFTEMDQAVLDTVAAVSTMAYLNVRLSEEMTRASTLLGMGKVSHDIGNLAASLYANLSFSDMAVAGLREQLAGKKDPERVAMYVDTFDEMVDDIKQSVDRIVGYSRLISDLSAGRELRPTKTMGTMSDTIRNSTAYLEPEGRKNAVAIRYEIQEDAPTAYFDELYLFRIVQNLVGNAIKAVKETMPDDWQSRHDEAAIFGEVTVRYRFENESHLLEISDTGPGMPTQVSERILSGTARSQWDKGGGSGWGTKIVLELAATHDAKVSIDSEIGHGSTFRVVFPRSEVLSSKS